MTRLETFRRLMVAEELFEFLGVAWDPRVLRTYRLHLLHRFALEMDLIDRQHPGLPEEARLEQYRQALVRAHALFQRSAPQIERLSRVPGAEAPPVRVPRRRG
jgi:nitrogenase-stabilizing/protective protein